MLESAMVVNFIVLAFSFFQFRSATFIWTVPGLVLPLLLVLKNRFGSENNLSRDIITLVYVALMIIVTVPFIMALLQAMTFGGLSVAMLVFMTVVITIIPVVKSYHENIPFFDTWSFN